MNPAPTRRQKSTVRPSKVSTRHPLGVDAVAARAAWITATRSSADRSGCLRGFARTADDDPLEDAGRPADHVEMAVRDRVERAGIDRDRHLGSPPSVRR